MSDLTTVATHRREDMGWLKVPVEGGFLAMAAYKPAHLPTVVIWLTLHSGSIQFHLRLNIEKEKNIC